MNYDEEDRTGLRGLFHFFTNESIATIRRPNEIMSDNASYTVMGRHLPHGRKPTLDCLLQGKYNKKRANKQAKKTAKAVFFAS